MTSPTRVPGKRLFDILGSFFGLVVASPAMAAIWVLVRRTSPGPAIYRGERVGLDGQNFRILKFRTMWDEDTSQLTTGLDDPRVTPLGRILRRYKLDELPQMINVLRGDMSLVGPRPEMARWVALYDADERRILEVRPGITDYASLEFIDLNKMVGSVDADMIYLETAFRRKNELRLSYVDKMSWRTDIGLLCRTVVAIFAAGRK